MGVIEIINKTMLRKVRSMIFTSNTPKSLWGEAVLAAVYLYNRTPHSGINHKTPYELKYNEKPDISHIRTWGSICFYKIKTPIKELDPKGHKAILIGFGQNQYRVWDIELKKPIWSRDVIILQNKLISSINQDNSIIEQSSITEHNASIYQNIQDNSQSHESTENTQDNPAFKKTNMYMKIPSSITNQDGYLEEDELSLTIQLKMSPIHMNKLLKAMIKMSGSKE